MLFRIKLSFKLTCILFVFLGCYYSVTSVVELFSIEGVRIGFSYYLKSIMFLIASIISFILVIEIINFKICIDDNKITISGGFLFKSKAEHDGNNLAKLYHDRIVLKNHDTIPINFVTMENHKELYYCFYNMLNDKMNVDDKVKRIITNYIDTKNKPRGSVR